MNLYDYLDKNLSRQDPHPVIDFSIRAEKHTDGRISFYIHADGRDSDTEDYWVEGYAVKEKRLADEPLPESVREKILEKTRHLGAWWGYGNENVLLVDIQYDHQTVTEFIESVGDGVVANYLGTEGDDYLAFKPAFGDSYRANIGSTCAAMLTPPTTP